MFSSSVHHDYAQKQTILFIQPVPTCNGYTWANLTVTSLNNLRPMFQAYRNQSNDLDYKSIGWFLYRKNIDLEKKLDQPCLKILNEYRWTFIKAK